MVTEIGGFNETSAAGLFASQAHFMLGCQFASLVVDTFLAGILTMQIYHYFAYQPEDKWWTKGVVIWVTLMNVVVTIYYWAYISYLFVDSYGRWLPWLEVRWLALMPTFDVMCISVVQGFFAYRAFLLNKRNSFLLILISCFILAAAGAGVGLTVVFGSQSSLLGAAVCGSTLITWNTLTTAADVTIAFSILYALLKSKSGWAYTDRLVTRLIRLTFEAQLPPTFLAVAYIAEWSVQPSSLLGAFFQAIQCKAYTVGLLFSLNARIALNSQNKETNTAAPQVYGMTSRGTRHPTNQIQVDIETETYVVGGYEDIDQKKDSMSEHDLTNQEKDLEYENNSTAYLNQQTHHVLV